MPKTKGDKLTLHYIKPYTILIAGYGFCVVFGTLFMMATALSVADFLKLLFQPETSVPTANGNLISNWLETFYFWMIDFGKSKALWLFSALLIILFLFKNLFGYLSAVISGVVRNHILCDLRNDMFTKAMALSIRYYTTKREGDILSRFGNDIAEYDENVLVPLHTLVSSIVTLVLYLLMLFYINVQLTVVILFSIPFIALVISRLSRKLKRTSKVVQDRGGELLSQTEEAIHGLRLIKAFNAIGFTNDRYRNINNDYSRRRTNMYRRINAASPISEFLGNIVVIAVLLFGSLIILRGGSMLTPELFVSYLMLFVLMLPPAKNVSTAFAQIRRGKGCVTRINDFLNESDVEKADNDKPSLTKIGKISLCNVSLSYDLEITQDTPHLALSDVSFEIPEGKTTALVGMSGSGKSSISNLLLRFYNASNGSIKVDGRDIRDYSTTSWRSRIGVVDQVQQLFNDTIANNIAYGMTGATRQDIVEAARIADADGFIAALPDGYDTIIGEGGAMLSGGQRQRICIARALIGNPDLIIFDEATSSLDTESEQQVQQSIDTALRGRTSVIIAHRLSTIRNADQIVVLDKGRIVEIGNHEQLIVKHGLYCQLLQGNNRCGLSHDVPTLHTNTDTPIL